MCEKRLMCEQVRIVDSLTGMNPKEKASKKKISKIKHLKGKRQKTNIMVALKLPPPVQQSHDGDLGVP